MSRSSSSASFERLESEQDVDASFVSVSEAVEEEEEVSRSPSPVSDVEEEVSQEELMREELASLRTRCLEQELQIELLKIERVELSKDAKSDEAAFKTALTGNWKLTSSTNLQEFIDRRRILGRPSEIDDVVFQAAEQNIAFNDDHVDLYENVGDLTFNEISATLGEPLHANGTSQVTFIAGDVIKTISVRMVNDRDTDIQERFVKDNKLHVVTRKHGVVCTRIYTRNDIYQLRGLWRQIGSENRTISLDFKDNSFYRKIRNSEDPQNDVSDVFEIGGIVNKWKTYIRDSTVVQKMYSADGKVTVTRKRFVENGLLVSVEEGGDKPERWTFERIGDALKD